MRELRELHAPYPGLRPFEPHELPVFFGREAHVGRLIDILARERFLAVIGPSGAGKSSLVRAGLLPALTLGWTSDVSDWRIATMRPGDRPLRRLAAALLQPDVLGPALGNTEPAPQPGSMADPALPALVEAELRRGPRGLIDLTADALAQQHDRPPFNLLVLVDQFEELFRYANLGSAQVNEAEAFVSLLLLPRLDEAPPARRIHVVLTMRTDALHDCARFLDLPEAINHGQYLVPRLKPDELRRAIAEPARVFEGRVDAAVVDRLVGRVQESPDQLPLLQHALAQMWEAASERDSRHPTISLQDLQTTGGIDKALSQHANRIYGCLSAADQERADLLFRAITEQSDGGARDARRPQRLDRIARSAGLAPDQWPLLEPVLRGFAVEGANFLQFAEPLAAETVVDLSHEALIRQWDRLRALADWEAALAAQYRRWAERSRQHQHGGELLAGADLAAALAWRDGQAPLDPGVGQLADGSSVVVPWRPGARWAARYAPAVGADPAAAEREFERVLAYIDASDIEAKRQAQERHDAEQREVVAKLEAEYERTQAAVREQRLAEDAARRSRRLTLLASTVALVALIAAACALWFWLESLDKTRAAEDYARRATVLRLAAEGQAMVAGLRPGGTEQGLLELLAAHRLAPGVEPYFALQASVAQTERMLKLIPAGGEVVAVAFSPDGQRIVSGSEDKTLRLWDAKSGAPIGAPLRGHDDAVSSVAFSPDGQRIVSGSGDKTLRLWDAKSGAPIGAPLRGHDEAV